MCMVDGGDGYVLLLSTRFAVAHKTHRCAECGREIVPGERYCMDRYVWDGEFHNHKTCAHCDVARQWLAGECGGWLYTAVEEDIREHATSGAPFSVMRLAVGMAWQWRTPRGKLLPVPKLPHTTHERVLAPNDQHNRPASAGPG